MQRLGGVVIHMQLNSNQVKFVIGNNEILQKMENNKVFQPFDDNIIEYLNNVSKILLQDNSAKQYPDVITFAFWCRKAAIHNLQNQYSDIENCSIGRGVAFHIAPSNVPVNFAYSLVVGMLSGCANVVRLPSKDYEQVDIICNAFSMVLNDEIKQNLCLIKYGHDDEINDYLSSICDVRIIWGGNQTISNIRKSNLNPRATEITFADRYSICIINSDEYINELNKEKLALNFYNDTFLSDQNACTSPRAVIWMGKNKKNAQEIFWYELHKIIVNKYKLMPIQVVNKYINLCKHAIMNKGVHLEHEKDNYIIRIKVEELNDRLMDCIGNSGYFIEYDSNSLSEILPLCISRCQTITYFGISADDIKKFILEARIKGIDRIVPMGSSMDFSLNWDGYDLIRHLTRKIIAY